MYSGVIESITKVEEYDDGLCRLLVSMDDLSSYTLFGYYNEYLDFIGKNVEFTTRKDIVNGLVTEVISNIATKQIVQCVDSKDDEFVDIPSLVPDKSSTVSVVTFNKDTLKEGDVAQSQIVFVIGASNGKSKVTTWKDFSCLDKNSKVFNLRLFSNDSNLDEFVDTVTGKYVMVGIKRTQYGFQVYDEMSLYDQEVVVPSEVLLSAFKLRMIVDKDDDLSEYVSKYDMIEKLKGIIYYEPGYHLVEMAAECTIISALTRIFGIYNKKLLYRCVFASRGYLLGSKMNVSNPIINYHRIITSKLKDDVELINMVDVVSGIGENDVNKSAYLSIRRMVESIMKERRGLCEENSINSTIDAIGSEFGRMFSREI